MVKKIRKRVKKQNKLIQKKDDFDRERTILALTEEFDSPFSKITTELGSALEPRKMHIAMSRLQQAQTVIPQFKYIVLHRLGFYYGMLDIMRMILDFMDHPGKSFTYYIDDLLVYRNDHTPLEFMKKATKIVTTTKFLRDYFIKHYDIDRDKIVQVPTHINLDLVDKIKPTPMPDDKFYMLWASGGIAGLDLMEKIVKKLATYEEARKNIRLITINSGVGHARMTLAKYKLQQYFLEFVPYEHLIALEKSCNILLNPMSPKLANLLVTDMEDPTAFIKAKAEVKFCHAGAVQIPVLTTPIPSYKACIEHGENGFLVTKINEWVNLIMDCYKSPDLCKKVGKKAYEDICIKYDTEVVVDRYLGAFLHLPIKEKRAGGGGLSLYDTEKDSNLWAKTQSNEDNHSVSE